MVLQTRKLPQNNFWPASLQLVAKLGIEPGSLACQSLACLHGYPTYIRIIHFLFYPDGTPQMQLQQPDQLLQIHKADTSENVKINYKSVFNPHKTLVHFKALVGTGRIQDTVLAEWNEKYT
eukprot:2559078-Ditylum_brightwellii.AAC.1